MLIGLTGRGADGTSIGVGKDSVARMLAPVHLVEIRGREVDVRVHAPHDADRFAPLVSHAAICALADPIKVACMQFFDFSFDQLWGPSASRNAPDHRYPREHQTHEIRDCRLVDGKEWVCKRCGWEGPMQAEIPGPCRDFLTPRRALQQLAHEFGRVEYPDVWARLWGLRGRQLLDGVQIQRPPDAHTFVNSWYIKRTELVVAPDVRYKNEVAQIHAAGGQVWFIERGAVENGRAVTSNAHASEREAIMPSECDRVIVNAGSLDDLYERVREAQRAAA